MRSYAVALLVSVAAGIVSAADVVNPYKNAKVGDTLSYKMTAKNPAMNIDGTMTQTITEKTDKEVTVKTVTKMLGKEEPAQTTKIDLTKEFDPSAGKSGKIEKLKEGSEKVKMGDKEYDCNWTTYKVAQLAGAPAGFATEIELKVWLCKDVPGMVKMTTTGKLLNQENNLTLELTEVTNKK
jgi:predicted small secreted protein